MHSSAKGSYSWEADVGLYHWMSTTTYSQPKGFRCSAMYSAFSRTCASVTAAPKQSQLFQPMGGV